MKFLKITILSIILMLPATFSHGKTFGHKFGSNNNYIKFSGTIDMSLTSGKVEVRVDMKDAGTHVYWDYLCNFRLSIDGTYSTTIGFFPDMSISSSSPNEFGCSETSTLSDIEGKFPGLTADATFKLEAYNNMKNGKLHVTGKLKFKEGPFRFKESANFKIADW